MNWKYKQFEREMPFQEAPERVIKAAQAFASQNLPGWQITPTNDGFEGKGQYWSAAETVTLKVEPVPSGSKVTITLQVQRASAFGYMVVDVIGFYPGQLDKWIDGIKWHLSPAAEATNQLPQIPKDTTGPKLILGCMGCSYIILALSWLVQSVYAAIGLVTGSMYLLPYRESHGSTIHGIAGRIVAILFLSVDLFFVYIFWQGSKKQRRPKILYPDDK